MALNIQDRTAKRRPTLAKPALTPSVDRKEIARLVRFMTEEEKALLDELLRPRPGEIDWLPQIGPQFYAFRSRAEMLLYGGAAGGGKTDLLLGLAYYKHYRSAFFRREYAQLQAVMDRAHELFTGEIGRYIGDLRRRWVFYDQPGHIMEYGAAENLGSERKKQGHAHDAKLFDEGTQFMYSQFNYLRGWNRRSSSTPPNQLMQTVVACNPPQSTDERWIVMPWGPWLDKQKYPNGAIPGQLLYFVVDNGGNFRQVEEPGKYVITGGDIKVRRARESDDTRIVQYARSHTFIPSSLKDNAYLDDGQYASVLQSLPEPLRSQLLFGDFQAGMMDDPQQLIPTTWIEYRQGLWNSVYHGKPPAGMAMTQLGVDVARGGADATVLSPRWGGFCGTQSSYKGLQTKDGPKVAQLVVNVINPKTLVQVDAIGIGASPVDWLRAQGVRVVAVVVSESAGEETDRSGYLYFSNVKALMAWRLREAMDPDNKNDFAIPPDPELAADLAAYRYSIGISGIKIEDKLKMRENLGRSPDKGDSLILAGLPTAPIDFDKISQGLFGTGVRDDETRDQADGDAGFAPRVNDRDSPWGMGNN